MPSPSDRRFPRTLLLLPLLLLAGCHAPDVRDLPVGRTVLNWEDDARASWAGEGARPMATIVWYPAGGEAREEPWSVGPFRAGRSAAGAAIRSGGPLPLVVMSHGTGGSAAQMAWLGEALAGRGYLVAALNHHGNTAAEGGLLPEGFVVWWERARDVSVLLDHLLADEVFGSRIDPDRIAVAGFSLGGATALLVAGARIDLDRWSGHCRALPDHPACRLPPEAGRDALEAGPMALIDQITRGGEAEETVATGSMAEASFRDARVRAVYALAPALAPALDPASLAGIEVPVRLVVGSADDQVLADPDVGALAHQVPGASLEVLDGVHHYAFLAPCSLRGRLVLRALCRDPRGIARIEVHRWAARDLARFLGALEGAESETRRPLRPPPAQRAGNDTRRTTTVGTSRASVSTQATSPPGPMAMGKGRVPAGIVPR